MKMDVTRPSSTDDRASWYHLIARGLLSLVLSACLVEGAREAIASWSAGKNSLDGIRRAQRWDPSNPEYPAQFARTLAVNSPGVDPRELIRPLEEATRLGPNRADTWASLAGAFEAAGEISDSASAYRRALELFPRSPDINWELANHLIRAGEGSKAIAPLRQAILGDPSLRTGAFDLAWRAGILHNQILEILPVRQEILSAYLDYLVGTNRLDAAASVWDCLLAQPETFDLDSAFRYFDALLRDHRVEKLGTVWADLARHDPARIHWHPGNKNLIMNGGFEDALLNGGFDWRAPAIEGAAFGFDTANVHGGARSFFLHFDGTRNLEFGNIVQYVSVEPDTSYRFLAYVRTEGITTDSGPRLAIYDAFDRKTLSLETENLLDTTSWREQKLEFHTGRETRLIVVQVARPRSLKLDNQIAGTLWLDDISLSAIP